MTIKKIEKIEEAVAVALAAVALMDPIVSTSVVAWLVPGSANQGLDVELERFSRSTKKRSPISLSVASNFLKFTPPNIY